MRVIFFDEKGDEHLFSVEDMDAPRLNDTIWTNCVGPITQAKFDESLKGHIRWIVRYVGFSIILGGSPHINNSSHCEVYLKKAD